MKDRSAGMQYIAHCDRWLSSREGDGRTFVDFPVTESMTYDPGTCLAVRRLFWWRPFRVPLESVSIRSYLLDPEFSGKLDHHVCAEKTSTKFRTKTCFWRNNCCVRFVNLKQPETENSLHPLVGNKPEPIKSQDCLVPSGPQIKYGQLLQLSCRWVRITWPVVFTHAAPRRSGRGAGGLHPGAGRPAADPLRGGGGLPARERRLPGAGARRAGPLRLLQPHQRPEQRRRQVSRCGGSDGRWRCEDGGGGVQRRSQFGLLITDLLWKPTEVRRSGMSPLVKVPLSAKILESSQVQLLCLTDPRENLASLKFCLWVRNHILCAGYFLSLENNFGYFRNFLSLFRWFVDPKTNPSTS